MEWILKQGHSLLPLLPQSQILPLKIKVKIILVQTFRSKENISKNNTEMAKHLRNIH